MTTKNQGHTLAELITVLAVSAVLLATTIPLGAYWINTSKLSRATGEMSHGFGKAIAAAIRNEQALDRTNPAAALCLSDTNQLSVLQANPGQLPNCATNEGTSVWTSAIPDEVAITGNGNSLTCMCFNSYGLQTTHGCASCTIATVVDVTVGNREEALHVR